MKKITTEKLLANSTRAFCGISEREVSVASQNVDKAIERLQRAGFHIVGTSHAKTPRKKIWFIRPGAL